MALTPEEELELQQLEQDEELKQYEARPIVQQPAVDTSIPEALARGAAQELTFGTADEMAAALESALTEKDYEKALEESRAEYKMAEEQHPIASLAGGLAGGGIQAAGLSALAGPAGLAAGGSKLQKLAQAAKGLLLPDRKASAIENIRRAATAGAAYGGLSAIGRSEEEGLERLSDVPAGLASGAAIGGALGTIGEGLGKAAQFASKKIEAGEAPYTAQVIRDAFKLGEEGQGFLTMKSRGEVEGQFMDAAKDVTEKVGDTLKEMRTVRNFILSNVDDPIYVGGTFGNLNKQLKTMAQEGLMDAENVREVFKKLYKIRADKADNMSVAAANDLITKMEGVIEKNPALHSDIKKTVYESIKQVKAQMRMSVDKEKALAILQAKNPELLPVFEKYVGKSSPLKITDEVVQSSPEILPQERDIFADLQKEIDAKTPKQAKEAEKEFNKALKELSTDKTIGTVKLPKGKKTKATKKNIADLKELAQEAQKVADEKIADSPLQRLDAGMHQILNASEKVGDITSGRTEAEKMEDMFKIFRNINAQTRDNMSGNIARERYKEALENIKKASPELANQIEQRVAPSLKKMEVKKFLEGASLGEGFRESGLVQSAVKGAGQITAGTANILGQMKGAARRGEAGPLPFVSTTIRPQVSTMAEMKRLADSVVASNPNSGVWKFISESLDSAVNEADEGRRAAILNTLMQYPTFREMIKLKDEQEK